jgi:hypothetical protein
MRREEEEEKGKECRLVDVDLEEWMMVCCLCWWLKYWFAVE